MAKIETEFNPSEETKVLDVPRALQKLEPRPSREVAWPSSIINLRKHLVLTNPNYDPPGDRGIIVFQTSTGRYRGFDGANWRDLCFHDERNDL